MKVNILASGSQGNCISITSEETTILVDVGIAKTKIEKRLLDIGIMPNNIAAILVTHAHADHIKGVPLANKYKIPVFASEGEWKDIQGVDEPLKNVIESAKQIDCFKVVAFKVHHDAFEPLGYSIRSNDTKVSICLDTGHVDANMLDAMAESDIYIIESNHEPNMVEVSSYPNSVKARILSHIGHLSNMQTAGALTKLVQGRGERIYLTHLSSTNNMPALAEMTVIRSLAKRGFKQDKHYKIEVV